MPSLTPAAQSTDQRSLPSDGKLVRKAFPPLDWLKAHVNHGSAWPSLIMNATVTQNWRPDIRGPLTLFLNLHGTSHCEVDHYRVPINEDVFFITNPGQHYSLEIDSPTPVETFNLHFADGFLEQALASLILKPEQLLSETFAISDSRSFCFTNRLYPRDSFFTAWLQQVRKLDKTSAHHQEFEASQLELLLYLLSLQQQIQQEIARLPALKQGTRAELYLRLNRARDQLMSSGPETLSLEQLADTACLSKYHFLRLFKAAYGITPHQFQLNLRINKARKLLTQTHLNIQEIAWTIGSEDPASFSRQFRKQVGVYPSQYRLQTR